MHLKSYTVDNLFNFYTTFGEMKNIEEKLLLHNILNILTVAVCLTDEDITTGLMDMFATVYAKV